MTHNLSAGSSEPVSAQTTLLLFKQFYRAAVFDLDGVIVDTAQYHFNSWKNLALEIGINLPPEANERLKGSTRPKSLDIVLSYGNRAFDQAEKNQLIDRTRSDYLSYIQTMSAKNLLPGVLEYLQQLKAMNIKIALGSSSRGAQRILEQTRVIQFFEVIVDGAQTQNHKPHPEVFISAAQKLNIPPEHCVVFEDSTSGLQAARAAGMFSIGVGEGVQLKIADLLITGFNR